MSVFTFVYSRTHTAVFVADNVRNVLRDIITGNGLDPTKMIDDWPVTGNALRTWLQSEDLLEVSIEFFVPGATSACARWDFPIKYDGSGVDDDMWVARTLIRGAMEKSARPPANADYRVLLTPRPGHVHVDGMVSTTFRSTAGLVCRSSGTAIATPDIMTGLIYWRAA